MDYALVTGGCSGIGFAYASVLAEKGYNILIVSNQEEENEKAAAQLRDSYHVEVHALYADLAHEKAAQQLFDTCQREGWIVEVLVNNAGMFYFDLITEQPLARTAAMVELHITTPTLLCALFGSEMKKHGKGYILNASSITAWKSFPGLAVYGTSKRYIKAFSRSLADELNDFGVKVCAVCPGAVDTALYNLSPEVRRRCRRWGVMLSPEAVARKGVKALFKGKVCYVPGCINYLFIFLFLILPHWLINFLKRKFKLFTKSA
jgi:short-subunit dehydrogenase